MSYNKTYKTDDDDNAYTKQPEEVERQKQAFLAKLRTLARKWTHKNQSSTIILTKIINLLCERQINYLLENVAEFATKGQRFDLYYREKSEFAIIKILDYLKTRLLTEGINATILTEFSADTGRYDIVIVQNTPCKVYDKSGKSIKIEVKTGFGLNLGQIERYLWDFSPLILVRVITGHVVKIKPHKLRPYILFSLKELSEKIDRLLSGKFYTIPGNRLLVMP